jgi:hypothetical protein
MHIKRLLKKKKKDLAFKITIGACNWSTDDFDQIIILKVTSFFYEYLMDI